MGFVSHAAFGIPYGDAFPEGLVDRVCRKYIKNHRKRVFPPETVIKLWIAQIISGGQSCSDAVARLSAFYALKGRSMSAGTGGYVQARQRLPINVIKDLTQLMARHLEKECADYRIIDRPLWTVDGSTTVLSDTDSICEDFPKSSQFAPGTGLPLSRFTSINSATTGAILSLGIGAMSGKGTGEMSLFREGWVDLDRGDVVVGDRLYSGYSTMALLSLQGVDTVFRRNKMLRISDLPTVQKIARHDRVVEVKRGFPSHRALPEQLWKMVPPTQLLRVVRYQSEHDGRETKPVSLISSLCSPKYTTQDLADVYAARWFAETDFRSFKSDLGADRLACKTPEMIEKELWMVALANNVVRVYMARAARYAGLKPREISFKRTMQIIDRYAAKFDEARFLDRQRLMTTMLGLMAENRVGNRPDRYEPRALKHIGMRQPVLKHPRHIARRDRLYQGVDKKPHRRKRSS